jgi:outer membrane immunogenic protein
MMKVKSGRLCICLVLGVLMLTFGAVPVCQAAADWQGFYGGVQFGYGWGKADTDVTPLPTAVQFINLKPTTEDPNPKGVVGGLQAGYNHQMGKIVVGAETDFSLSDMRGSKDISPIIQNNGTPYPGNGKITVHQDTIWFGTLRLRFGIAPIPKLLLYGTGGLAYGHVQYEANTDFRPVGTCRYPASFSKAKLGWTLGVGGEFALSRRWSVKVEYKYYDLGSESETVYPIPANPPFQEKYKWETIAHIGNIGLNYRF